MFFDTSRREDKELGGIYGKSAEELTAMVHSGFFWLTSFEPLSLLLQGGKYLRGRYLFLKILQIGMRTLTS